MKELICVLFGHQWSETGHRTCQVHHHKFAEYKICGRCDLQKNISKRYCQPCMDKFHRENSNGKETYN